MALKEFDDTKPRTRDKNWKEDISVMEMPKMDEWYSSRIVGGVFSYAQHWIEFTNKEGEKKRYPIDCANWDQDAEACTKKGGCPACELGLSSSARYMMNAIDRQAQNRGDADPIRALDVPPTIMRQLKDLKKLNLVKGEAKSIAHPKFGCDVHMQKQRSKKRGGVEWQVQKGDRAPLTPEEEQYELISFDQYWMEPDVHKIREDLKRHGYFGGSDEKETTSVPGKKNTKSASSDDDEEFEGPSRSTGKPKTRPPVEDEDEVRLPPKSKAKPPVDVDDEEDEAPPKVVSKKKPPVDEDDAPPPRTSKKRPPVDDEEDDDFENDFDV